MRASVLRVQLESALGGRIPSPFTRPQPHLHETVSTGVPKIDSLTGGLPRGALTEIFGTASSGRTSLMLSILSEAAAREEVSALVDARSTLDPASARAAGVVLSRLLWVRCKDLEQALKAADFLLQGGGFGVVVVDLGDIAPDLLRRVPLAFWFRFQRVIEKTPTVLVVLEPEPSAKTCASLVLRLERSAVEWSVAVEGQALTQSSLLVGMNPKAEVVRCRHRPEANALSLWERVARWERPKAATNKSAG